MLNYDGLKIRIFQIVGEAVTHLTGDKTLPETFRANVADYLYDNFDEFIAHYERVSIETVSSWLSEFPIETIQ